MGYVYLGNALAEFLQIWHGRLLELEDDLIGFREWNAKIIVTLQNTFKAMNQLKTQFFANIHLD